MSEKPIEEMLRGIPKDHRICIPFQWAEDGRETGHHYIPVGRHAHQAAAEIATLREALSRLVEVHDAMGGMCSPERILAEAALAKGEGK